MKRRRKESLIIVSSIMIFVMGLFFLNNIINPVDSTSLLTGAVIGIPGEDVANDTIVDPIPEILSEIENITESNETFLIEIEPELNESLVEESIALPIDIPVEEDFVEEPIFEPEIIEEPEVVIEIPEEPDNSITGGVTVGIPEDIIDEPVEEIEEEPVIEEPILDVPIEEPIINETNITFEKPVFPVIIEPIFEENSTNKTETLNQTTIFIENNIIVQAQPQISLDIIYPLESINVTLDDFFNISVNVTCSDADCGEVNVSLDPDTTIYNFSNCNNSGRLGPSLTNCTSFYNDTTLEDLVGVVSGIQNWTVPATGTYTIEAGGARGGNSTQAVAGVGGNGSKMSGSFDLTAGEVIFIVIGQMGEDSRNPGGGGASYVYRDADDTLPLIVAGGGGGGSYSGSLGGNSPVTENGTNGFGMTTGKGVSGHGAIKPTSVGNSNFAGGGAGWLSDGIDGLHTCTRLTEGGYSPRNGSNGGLGNAAAATTGEGGFGGGGGGQARCGAVGGGGGGGYSGGGSGGEEAGGYQAGGAGGSYNGGTSQNNSAGINDINGYVTITSTASVKGGLVSTNTSKTPFYTNTTNPYNLTLNQDESQVITWWVNATGSLNDYIFYVYANTTSNMSNSNITDTWNVTIKDKKSPIINITYPDSITYNVSITDLNYTYFDKIGSGSCWYSIDSGATNQSVSSSGTNFTGLSTSDGSNTWDVYCNDSSNNFGSSSITFTSSVPSISLTIVSPSQNINVTQNESFEVSVTVSCTNNDCGDVNVSLDPFPVSDEQKIIKEYEEKIENDVITQSAITLLDNKSFSYDIQDGCELNDGQSDVFDGGIFLYINNSVFNGARSSTEDDGREAYCTGTTMSSLNISRKVYVPHTANWSRYLEVLHNTGSDEACVNVKIYSNMGSDGSDFINTSDYNITWEIIDHWLMWDDTSITAGDDAAGFVYQQDGATETIDSVNPTSVADGTQYNGLNEWIWNDVCVPAGDTKILMHFFTQMDTRAESEAEANDIYINFEDDEHLNGMSDDEKDQVVNWVLSGATKSGLISMDTTATPFYTTTQNPYNTSLSNGESETITWTVNATGDINTTHEFYIFANQTFNMSVSDETAFWNVTISNSTTQLAPIVTISTPSDNTFTLKTDSNITYTLSGSTANSCWYGYNSVNKSLEGCANITSLTWSEGEHIVTIYANDSNNNVGSSSVTFTVDLTIPLIDIAFPTNNTVSSNTTLNVNYTVIDTNVNSCWYSNDSMSINTTLASCANITTVTWSEGQHNVTVWVNDSATNQNSTGISFTIDTTAPTITITSPTNISNVTDPSKDIIYSVSDNVEISSCWYANDTMSINTTLVGCTNLTTALWPLGEHNVTIWVNDTSGNINSTSVTFTYLLDADNDNLPDTEDTLLYNESNVTKSGVTRLNITVGGNKTNGTFTGRQEFKFYDENTLLFNFTHNFSQATFDLSNVTIIKDSNYMIINLSGQLLSNKTLYLTDNSFITLCVKDMDVGTISEVSSTCTGTNETDFTDCLGNSTGITINGTTCIDEGTTISVSNLQYSAVKGTVSASSSDESSASGGSGGSGTGGGGSGAGGLLVDYECSFDSDCGEEYVCYEHQCVKLFDVKIIEIDSPIGDDGYLDFTYFIKGMANINSDVIVNFWLEKDSEIISSGQDTIYLGSFEEKTETTQIYVPQNLDNGSYQFHVQVDHENYQAVSFRTVYVERDEETSVVLVQEKAEISVSNMYLFTTFTFLILMILLLLILHFKRNKSSSKMFTMKKIKLPKMVTISQRSKLPKLPNLPKLPKLSKLPKLLGIPPIHSTFFKKSWNNILTIILNVVGFIVTLFRRSFKKVHDIIKERKVQIFLVNKVDQIQKMIPQDIIPKKPKKKKLKKIKQKEIKDSEEIPIDTEEAYKRKFIAGILKAVLSKKKETNTDSVGAENQEQQEQGLDESNIKKDSSIP
ncbi:hypothetical protein HOL21_00280 [Candidatus Woesearchaeota archaeon]|nr:hypothetical protein [Candidatus Woesearchaeota archaeon]